MGTSGSAGSRRPGRTQGRPGRTNLSVKCDTGSGGELQHSGRRRLRLALIFLGLCLAAFLALAVFLDAYGQVDRAAPAQAIVVLGARVTAAGLPGDSLRARTLQ